MPSLDLRSSQLNVTFPAGHPFTVALNGPAGWLDSRTFTATLDGLSLDVSEDDDQLLIAVDAVTSEAVTRVARFELVGNVDGETLVGDWAPRTDGTGSAVTETTVTLGTVADVDVTLILLANPAIVGGGGEGGVVNEVAAATGITVDDSDPTAPVISAAPAIATAATDATTKANAAQAAAISSAATDATTKANAAQAAAISAASTDATTKASAAQAAAIAAAATDATTKANAAQAGAISAASTDATTKANAAQSAATSAAATDATTKANAAQSAATSAAATDATTKANAAAAASVPLSGAATKAGVLTLSSAPVVPDTSFTIAKTIGLQTALDGKALATDLDTLEADVAALPELASANPAELSLSTVGTVTTVTLTTDIARSATFTAFLAAARPKVVGHYFHPHNGNLSVATTTLNRLTYFPAWLRAGTVDRIGIEVSTAVATAVGVLGIYADDGAGSPGALIAQATGTQDLNSVGFGNLTISAVLPTSGRYHLAFVSQTAAGTIRTVTSNDPFAAVTLGTTLPTGGTAPRLTYHTAGVSGASLPSTAAAPSFGSPYAPMFVLRYSA